MSVRREAYILTTPAALLFLGIVAVPLVMTVILSLNEWSSTEGIIPVLVTKNYREIFSDSYFAEIFFRTLRISLLVTLTSILIGVPEAYILRRMREPWRSMMILVVIGPLLVSVVARTLGWALILAGNGILSQSLQKLGLVNAPVSLMFTETGVVIALTHVLVPFMVLAVWASLGRMDPSTERAASSLGAGPATIFRRIVLPQAMPGILSGSIVVFTLSASAFATPAIIGGRRLKVAATLAYDEFLNTLNWPLGAAIAVLLLIGIVFLVIGWNRLVERRYSQVFSS
ncbi:MULTISPECIES: ABC transporter permease [Rhizobium/Agrobacterium group]|uniref:ABC transporter membrane spanning protein (Mannopine) n=2 Tax=Rhizobium/Agrobacterium group TaxID=227290 RepID=B9K465_ALLAM|nr:MULTISPECIES: ABC transporter permease [Rhizobium/Agrobacterium group]ACM39719.1 ABC transporter membrane spanning protein (mannopine) [Allorhizobium ampelinum S4]ASK49742.1 ABC transporter permease [Agrobacterium vitis]MCF1436661.1 ABC transporter permease [Allorhizobium ampelinum]MCF1450246.1 ABC transporter permease [Allorhizobium ampelinum]MCF1495925.1 ABC transporter permease [Allorhizobium ampelinum]